MIWKAERKKYTERDVVVNGGQLRHTAGQLGITINDDDERVQYSMAELASGFDTNL